MNKTLTLTLTPAQRDALMWALALLAGTSLEGATLQDLLDKAAAWIAANEKAKAAK